MISRVCQQLTIVAFAITLSACASFHNEKVTVVGKLPDVSGFEHKPRVFIDLKFYMGNPQTDKVTEIPQGRDMLIPELEALFRSEQLFSAFTFDQFKQNEMDYKLTLHFYNHGEAGAAAIGGLITGLTLFVIPSAATDNYTLKYDLAQAGSELVSKQSTDSMTTWFGIWFLPMAGKTPQATSKALLVNQVKSAIEEMIQNKELQYSLMNAWQHSEVI